MIPLFSSRYFVRELACLLLFVLLSGSISISSGGQDEKEKARKAEKSAAIERLGKSRERWDSLSEEDREKLKAALRDVWTDPGVISAREELKRASDDYQKAIRASVSKADPSVVDLLKEPQSPNRAQVPGRPGSGPGGRFGPRRIGEYSMGPPGFLEKLSSKERDRFKKAEKVARETTAVLQIKKELASLEAQGDQLRRRRMEIHRKMREAVLGGMLEEDPGLKEILVELQEVDRRKGKLGADHSPPGPPSEKKDSAGAKKEKGK